MNFASSDRRLQFDRLLAERKDMIGACAEFGVYDGGNTINLARSGRIVYAFDTFEGIPASEFEPEIDIDEPGKFKPKFPPEEMFKYWPNVIWVEGLFRNTIPVVLDSNIKFVLVHLDCDLYSSTKQVLKALPQFIQPNSVIVCDDYNCPRGATRAINKFLARWKLKINQDNEVVWNA